MMIIIIFLLDISVLPLSAFIGRSGYRNEKMFRPEAQYQWVIVCCYLGLSQITIVGCYFLAQSNYDSRS